MGLRVASQEEMKIGCEDDVVLVRRRVRELAEKSGFNTFAAAAVTTATSELTRNVWIHGKGGQARIEVLEDGNRKGLRVTFTDRGPGIPDIEKVLRGGFSTARSLGLGLSGSKRLVDDFRIHTKVGEGTEVSVVKWAGL